MTALREIDLFSRLPEEALRLLAFGTSHARRRKGQRLFTAGAPAMTAYIVLEGAVALTNPGDSAGSGPVLGPGTLVGEYALFCDTTRPQTAVMAEDGELLEIPRLLMRRVLEEFPEVAEDMQAAFAARLGETMTGLARVREQLRAIGGESDDQGSS